MPHIEVLPTTSKAAAPGWSYVIDTGYDPSKAAINPTSRKRARVSLATGPSASDLSIRQQTTINRHLEELDRDSHKPVVIALPTTKGTGAGTRKQTSNTRRILASGKDFGHYLDQEEAVLGGKGEVAEVVEVQGPKVQRASKTPIARRKPVVEGAPGLIASASTVATAGVPATVAVLPASMAELLPTTKQQTEGSDLLVNKTRVEVSTQSEIEALLNAPPLSYNAARSAPPSGGAPRRVFCEICGYWGRVRCLKCGGMVCGLECKGVHDESRCVRF